MKISPPNPDEYAPFYHKYVSRVETKDPLSELEKDRKELLKFFATLKRKQLKYRYAPGKWNIKEILCHMIDSERIFTYRALRFARNDKTELAGFEEKHYVAQSHAEKRKLKSLLSEYRAVREASIQLFSNFNEEEFMRSGIANGYTMSVRAMLYVILGHQRHHLNVIWERYLNPDYKLPTE